MKHGYPTGYRVMSAEATTRILVAQREELGNRAMNALALENVSPWNTTWEIEGRVMDALDRQMDEFNEIVAGLFDAAVTA